MRLLISTVIVALHVHLVLAQGFSPNTGFDALVMPEQERDFVGILAHAHDQLGSARTEQLKRNLRVEMQIQEANFAKQTPSALDWVGIVQDAGTDRDGFAWISIKISPDITLSTARSREVDPAGQTLIPIGTELYQIVGKLQTGQTVKFAATLIGGRLETDDQMVRYPEVTVRFTSLKPTK